MARLGLHPRVSNMVARGHAMGLGRLACLLGSLLGERDVLAARAPSADVALRLEALRAPGSGSAGSDLHIVMSLRDMMKSINCLSCTTARPLHTRLC